MQANDCERKAVLRLQPGAHVVASSHKSQAPRNFFGIYASGWQQSIVVLARLYDAWFRNMQRGPGVATLPTIGEGGKMRKMDKG